MLYASIQQLDPQMTDVLVDVICEMDAGFLAWCAANREESAKGPAGV